MMDVRTESPMPSMTLSISRDDAQRMMEASRSLNKRLRTLQHESEDDKSLESLSNDSLQNSGEGPPVSTREDWRFLSVHSFKISEGVRTLNELVMEAAMSCGDALLGSFLSTLKERECDKYVIQTSLLLFLDMDKSDKLSEAFRLLSQLAKEKTRETDILSDNDVQTITKDKEEADGLKSEREANKSQPSCGIDRDGAVTLFRCFLTAISSCIQTKGHANRTDSKDANDPMGPPAKVCKQSKDASPNTPSQAFQSVDNDGDAVELDIPGGSPSFDSAMDTSIASLVSLPRETLLEIDEIASFAAEKLIHFAKQQDETSLISFETFGDWYNSKGFMVVPWLELMDLAKWDVPINSAVGNTPAPAKDESNSANVPTSSNCDHRTRSSPVNFFVDDRNQEQTSRTLVSFDFTGTADDSSVQPAPICINITEDNLVTLKNLVSRTGLSSRSPDEIIEILLRQSTKSYIEGIEYTILEKNDFGRCIRLLVPAKTSRSFSRAEMEQFSDYFMTVFGCYENKKFGKAAVDVKELAIGFSVMCSGSKSVKLSYGFDLLDKVRDGHIDQEQLSKYVRSYLTMLVAISLLSATPTKLQSVSSTKQKGMLSAVENGAKWTLGHYQKSSFGSHCNTFTFESFAHWYTDGGYTVAPWLELLDLSKLLALLDEPNDSRFNVPVTLPRERGQLTSPRKRTPHGQAPVDVLFTFPLAKDRSLVVLREDATYVRSVVEKLGLLSMNPDDMWGTLFKSVKARPPRPVQPWSRHRKSGTGKSMDVDQATFVRCMEEIVTLALKENKRIDSKSVKMSSTSIPETIANFFQSFDLEQIDRVALNQLMGGLSLLCGGKKSTKLAFSFGLFDGRQEPNGRNKSQHPSLDGEELFLFLRSFLIVMFSCCRQSLDLSAEAVSRYISDTSHMVTEDVMRYQWHTRKRDRVDFDDFGEWYNEGGFETAPWLELLDLKKWVLVDDVKIESNQGSLAHSAGEHISSNRTNHYCPPPPPEDSLDPSFFGDDDNTLMPMDSIDEVDLLLMAQPSNDKENYVNFLDPNSPHPRSTSHGRPSSSLKFHLVTHDNHGGYKLTVSQKRVRHLRQILIESGLHKMDSETACRRIIKKATRVNGKLILKKADFDSAVRGILSRASATSAHREDSQNILLDLFSFLFAAFDRKKNGAPSALEIACGFTVICDGKKSDKLEFAFDALDENWDGKLSRKEMTNYLRSFLTVLLGVSTYAYLETNSSEDSFLLMSGKPCIASIDNIAKASKSASDWAANQAFKACFAAGKSEEELSFDDFADWYTRKGFGSIPWLELLDLKKWVLSESF